MKNIVIASKSGALDHLRSDVAIVYSQYGPVAMAITVNNIPEVDYGVDNPGQSPDLGSLRNSCARTGAS